MYEPGAPKKRGPPRVGARNTASWLDERRSPVSSTCSCRRLISGVGLSNPYVYFLRATSASSQRPRVVAPLPRRLAHLPPAQPPQRPPRPPASAADDPAAGGQQERPEAPAPPVAAPQQQQQQQQRGPPAGVQPLRAGGSAGHPWPPLQLPRLEGRPPRRLIAPMLTDQGRRATRFLVLTPAAAVAAAVATAHIITSGGARPGVIFGHLWLQGAPTETIIIPLRQPLVTEAE